MAKFLSGDPFIQDPTNGQNYNRYSYVLNNPTNSTDPTGFIGSRIEDIAIEKMERAQHAIEHVQAEFAKLDDEGKAYITLNFGKFVGTILPSAKTPPTGSGDSRKPASANDEDSNLPPPPAPGSVAGDSPSIRGYHVKKYKTDLLGKTVDVRIEAESDDKTSKIESKLSDSIERINDKAPKLSKSEVNIIRGIEGFTVDDMKITGINPANGIFNIRSSYLLGNTSTVAWIASAIAHDSFHRYQFLQGLNMTTTHWAKSRLPINL